MLSYYKNGIGNLENHYSRSIATMLINKIGFRQENVVFFKTRRIFQHVFYILVSLLFHLLFGG